MTWGRRQIEGLAAGRYEVRVSGEDLFPPSETVEVMVFDADGAFTEMRDGVSTTYHDDGSAEVTVTVTENGVTTVTTTAKDKDGNTVSTTVTVTQPDGSQTVTVTASDGSSVSTTTDSDGKVTEQTVKNPDGSTVKTENKPDGTTVVTKTDKTGKVTETIETAKDGSAVTTKYQSDGGKVVVTADQNGKVTETITYHPDGSYVKDGFTHVMTEGSGSSYRGKELTFRSNDAVVNFLYVTVNGKELDKKHYEVEGDSIQVTLKTSYLRTLKTGTYKLGIVSTNGAAEGTFRIPGNYEGVATGDTSHIGLWTALTLLNGVAAAGLAAYSVKKRKR